MLDISESMRDLKISWLSKLTLEESNKLYDEMADEFPDHLPMYQARLKKLTEKARSF